nr:MAG TPA: hypothetical protein [Caudoviricetes sp.]
MYSIQKTESIKESFEIKNSAGEAVVIDYEFKPTPQIVQNFRQLQLQILELKKNQDDIEKINGVGEAVLNLFKIIFGEKNTETIVQFYENDFTSMLLDILPYIQDKLIPQISERVKRHKKMAVKRFR